MPSEVKSVSITLSTVSSNRPSVVVVSNRTAESNSPTKSDLHGVKRSGLREKIGVKRGSEELKGHEKTSRRSQATPSFGNVGINIPVFSVAASTAGAFTRAWSTPNISDVKADDDGLLTIPPRSSSDNGRTINSYLVISLCQISGLFPLSFSVICMPALTFSCDIDVACSSFLPLFANIVHAMLRYIAFRIYSDVFLYVPVRTRLYTFFRLLGCSDLQFARRHIPAPDLVFGHFTLVYRSQLISCQRFRRIFVTIWRNVPCATNLVYRHCTVDTLLFNGDHYPVRSRLSTLKLIVARCAMLSAVGALAVKFGLPTMTNFLVANLGSVGAIV